MKVQHYISTAGGEAYCVLRVPSALRLNRNLTLNLNPRPKGIKIMIRSKIKREVRV
jgi:hypothetical protein